MYAQVDADKALLPEHRLAKLKADRQFRMEWEFYKTAEQLGIPVTARPIEENTWSYVYAKINGVGFTQSYIQSHDAAPQEAKFRQQLAGESGLLRLDLQDDNAVLFERSEIYALVAHTPMADKFTEQKQMLGSIQVCVPDKDMKSWVLRKSVAEILALYPSVTKKPAAGREPVMKTDQDRKKGNKR